MYSYKSTFTEGEDYTSVTELLTFNSSTTRNSVSIPIINDNVLEPEENFAVTIFESVMTSIDLAIVTIIDDDEGKLSLSCMCRPMQIFKISTHIPFLYSDG